MSTRKPSRLARVVNKLRHSAKSPVQSGNNTHGEKIWVYMHLQKNNVVYSLTKTLKNNATLDQIPFNGKKTVPSKLRKDLWAPFATISFSPGRGSIGLSAFQKLREYRRRHELEWGDEIMKDTQGNLVEKKKRGRLLCDQRANSVADMAAVFARLKLQEGFERKKGESVGLIGEGTGEKVQVDWIDLKNAEFAETWSENVEHGLLEWHRNNRNPDQYWEEKERREADRELASKDREELENEAEKKAWQVARSKIGKPKFSNKKRTLENVLEGLESDLNEVERETTQLRL